MTAAPILLGADTSDANSPFTLAIADAAGTHPLTVPDDAKGIWILVAGAAGDLVELAHGATKGIGYTMVGRSGYHFDFGKTGRAENWHLHTLGATGTVYVNYVY